jgi:hypothetical protein
VTAELRYRVEGVKFKGASRANGMRESVTVWGRCVDWPEGSTPDGGNTTWHGAYCAEIFDANPVEPWGVIATPVGEVLEATHYRSPQQCGTHARAHLLKIMILVGIGETGIPRRVHGMECRACGAEGTGQALAKVPCTAEREAEIAAARALTAEVEAKRAAAPLAPVTDEFASMGAAVEFLSGLAVGDRVRITKDGRTNDYAVTRAARREGSQGTTNVTVSIRPGGYAFEVYADHLYANRTGDKATWSMGGTRMMRTPVEEAPAGGQRFDCCGCVSCSQGRGSCVKVPSGPAWGVKRPDGRVVGPFARHAEALRYGRNVVRGGTPVALEPVAVEEAAPVEEAPAYTVQVSKRVVSGYAEECAYVAEEGHECTGDCRWLEGDSRELETPTTEDVEADADDLEAFGGDAVAWAVDYIWTKTDAVEPSASPVGAEAYAHEWLSGTSSDPYNSERETHTSVYLTEGWTDAQRAQVFKGVESKLRGH